MKFVYGQQNMVTLRRAQENCWLGTNGLGGYSSVTAAFSVTRNDHAVLMAAAVAPNDRRNLVHRLSEQLTLGEGTVYLSTQEFADGKKPEDGYRYLTDFTYEYIPVWHYQVGGVQVERSCAVAYGENTVSVRYRVENRSQNPCTLAVTPFMCFGNKGDALKEPWDLHLEQDCVRKDELAVFIKTDGRRKKIAPLWEKLYYYDDEKDGRPACGLAGACFTIEKTVPAGKNVQWDWVFSTAPTKKTAGKIIAESAQRQKRLEKTGHFRHPVAKQLSRAAEDFIAYRQSTDGMTILAGYPFFGDWGRDTMIALPGCALERGQFETAKSILRTFLAYEKDGLMPNLFPEGESKPMYNTVDAALLFINCIYLYYQKTGDADFVRESWQVMENIVRAYQTGTHHGIYMDTDGLISAGQGMDQVTWMDVCVEGILPTPRHGKPVEINAYWYNALRIMERFAPLSGADSAPYGKLADRVKTAFREKFYMVDKGYLKDVLSGTQADNQLRCNQIWAVTMPFTMLEKEQEKQVVETVFRHLYTPCGLRTLAPTDPEYRGSYGGPQKQRDLAYHQGTVWPFPLGAYYLAYLKVHDNAPHARKTVLQQLEALIPALTEGCAGQLPEIYEGDRPGFSQGCFAQAWSVGELLRVYAALEKGESL